MRSVSVRSTAAALAFGVVGALALAATVGGSTGGAAPALMLVSDHERSLDWSVKGRPTTSAYAIGANAVGLESLLHDVVAASWSPDGRSIAYVRNVPCWKCSDILGVSRADGRRRRVIARPGSIHETSVRWSPDSRRLLYTTYVGPAEPDALWVLDVVTRTSRRIPGGEPLSDAAWSPDGHRIAFVARRGLVVTDEHGGRTRTIRPRVRVSPWLAPSWSPDGRAVVVINEDDDCGAGCIMVVDLDGGSHPVAYDLSPWALSWSPRDRWIAFSDEITVGSGAKRRGVFLVRPDGTGLRQVLTVGGDPPSPLVWSPDGRYVATGVKPPGADSVPDVWVIDVQTGARRRLTYGWRYGYRSYPLQWHPLGHSMSLVPGTPVPREIPSDSMIDGGELRLRDGVVQLAADDGRVAVTTAGSGLEVWEPSARSVVRFPDGPNAGFQNGPQRPFGEVALGGATVTQNGWNHGGGTTFHNVATASVERPRFVHVRGFCSNAQVECPRALGHLRADGVLTAFDTWDCDDPAAQPWPGLCESRRRNGQAWRIDGLKAVPIVSGPGPATVLAVDGGRVLLDRGDGVLELVTASGALLRRFELDAGQVQGALVQGRDLVVRSLAAIEVTDAQTGDLVGRWPAATDAELVDVQDGVAVLVTGTTIELLRLTDGHRTTLQAPGSAPVLAQLESAGLFYAYRAAGAYPGRVRFVAWRALP
jgi:Tol biopolymer transport system component